MIRALLPATFLLLPFTAAAAPNHAVPSLEAESATFAPGRPLWLALKFSIGPGWHIYWKNPGDSGMSPSAKWRLPRGVSVGTFLWPTPKKIELPPLSNLGYEGEAALLAELRAPRHPGSGTLRLSARVDWLECRELCVPGSADVELALPPGDGAPDPEKAEFFSRARFSLPAELPGWEGGAFASGERVRLSLRPPGWPAGPARAVLFFPEDPSLIESITDGVIRRGGDGWVLDYPAGPRAPAAAGRERLKGVLFSEEGWRGPGSEKGLAVDIPLKNWDGVPALPAESAGGGLAAALLFAFLGGLLLNLMPCVLPVLSIKVLGVVNQTRERPGEARLHGLAYSAGVLASFWLLAGLLLALKAGGAELGWGFQLQSPPFVMLLAAVFFTLGLSMAGVFELGTSLIGLGRFASRPGPAGAFLGGVLAVAAATPCTAPFMGAALGFALVRSAWVSLAVFTAMAAGLALPFLLLSSSPALLKYMPRPGDWMQSLKQGMSFLLFGTVVWLIWVLGRQAGADSMAAAYAALLFIALGCWILGRWGDPLRSPAARYSALAAAALLAFGGLGRAMWTLRGAAATSAAGETAAGAISWETYSPELLDSYLRADRPVFIDFTADWCLTCQVNERTALRAAAVAEKFAHYGVAALKADWTRRDPAITRALAAYGRSGVPLYALHAPGKNSPRLLPALLTPGVVAGALDSELKKNK